MTQKNRKQVVRMYKMRQTFVSKQTNKALGLKATKFEKVTCTKGIQTGPDFSQKICPQIISSILSINLVKTDPEQFLLRFRSYFYFCCLVAVSDNNAVDDS